MVIFWVFLIQVESSRTKCFMIKNIFVETISIVIEKKQNKCLLENFLNLNILFTNPQKSYHKLVSFEVLHIMG